MPTLTVRDRKTITKQIINAIVEIRERNPASNIDHICNAIEQEVRDIRMLGHRYFDQYKDSPEVVASALRTKINAIDAKTNSFFRSKKAGSD